MRLSERLENFAIGRWFPARKAKRELADEARQLEDVCIGLYRQLAKAQRTGKVEVSWSVLTEAMEDVGLLEEVDND